MRPFGQSDGGYYREMRYKERVKEVENLQRHGDSNPRRVAAAVFFDLLRILVGFFVIALICFLLVAFYRSLR